MSLLGRRLALVSRDLLGMSSVCACRGEMEINLLKVYSLNLIQFFLLFSTNLGRSSSTLSEVGQLEPLRLQGNYDTGQMFLHKVEYRLCTRCPSLRLDNQVFGYRGVILFPWLARVYDRDMPSKPPNTRSHL